MDHAEESLRPQLLQMLSPADYQDCATRLKALADPDRLQIINCLLRGPRNVSQLAAELATDLVKVSHHLGVLRNADIVETQRDGKFVIYRLGANVAIDQNGDVKTIDLGCCRLDLPKPDRPPADETH